MAEEQIQKKRVPVAKVVCIAGILFCVLTYWFKPDILTAFWVYPFTIPGIVGFVFCAFAFYRSKFWRWAWTILWFGAWCGLADESQWLIPEIKIGNPSIKVVSLNCAGGTIEAVQEAFKEDPDVLLLQESPSKTEIEKLLSEKYSGVWGVDASIWVKGTCKALPIPRTTLNFVLAEADIKGRTFTICSLRLQPPVLRFDYWNPDCWNEYAEARQRRKTELDEVVQQIPIGESAELIIGGDFNTPEDPLVQANLHHIAKDSYRKAGKGWGKTAVNPWPLVRIDQIWIGQESQVISCISKLTEHSDHCMVVTMISDYVD